MAELLTGQKLEVTFCHGGFLGFFSKKDTIKVDFLQISEEEREESDLYVEGKIRINSKKLGINNCVRLYRVGASGDEGEAREYS